MWSFSAWLAVMAFQLIQPKWQICSISFNVFYSLMYVAQAQGEESTFFSNALVYLCILIKAR